MCLTGCGGKDRTEALVLAKVLKQQQAAYAKADAVEKDSVASATAWCGGITSSGAGKRGELDQNATVATAIANSFSEVSTSLSEVRQAVAGQSLKSEFNQTVRTDLMSRLSQRQRSLQEMRSLLQQSAQQFLDYRTSKTYAGDSFPGEIQKLDGMLKAYKAPDDAVAAALNALKTKYDLKDNEI